MVSHVTVDASFKLARFPMKKDFGIKFYNPFNKEKVQVVRSVERTGYAHNAGIRKQDEIGLPMGIINQQRYLV